jgi:uncharacterized protein (TIGR00255 family)
MKSMTGFGFCEHFEQDFHALVDLKSYNHRYLDIIVNIPPHLNRLEPGIREFLASRIARGRVEVYLRITEMSEDLSVVVDRSVLAAYLAALKKLQQEASLEDTIRLSHLLAMEGVLKTEHNRDMDRYWLTVQTLLDRVSQDWDDFRTKEGAKIRSDVEAKLLLIDRGITRVEEQKERLASHIRSRIEEKFKELLGEDMDEDRVYSETAVLLLKHDINEEIIRMHSLVSSFRETIAAKRGIGKRLEFICQELLREINTVGSKSIQADVHREVIDMKDALEKIREHLRNVE